MTGQSGERESERAHNKRGGERDRERKGEIRFEIKNESGRGMKQREREGGREEERIRQMRERE